LLGPAYTADQPRPLVAYGLGEIMDATIHDLPVHHRAGLAARAARQRRVTKIGGGDGNHHADNHSDGETHWCSRAPASRGGRTAPQERAVAARVPDPLSYLRCPASNLFISNMVTFFLPNTGSSLSSARISRLFCGFCRLYFLMCVQILLTASVR